MLVLSRKIHEKIQIGDHVLTITVLDIKGGRVRLGIEAPSDMRIVRQEIAAKTADRELAMCCGR